MVQMEGSYVRTEEKDYDKFLAALGVGFLLRKAATSSTPTMTISKSGMCQAIPNLPGVNKLAFPPVPTGEITKKSVPVPKLFMIALMSPAKEDKWQNILPRRTIIIQKRISTKFLTSGRVDFITQSSLLHHKQIFGWPYGTCV